MRLNDVESFINFHRMDPKCFDELLGILGPNLRNQPSRVEEEIGPAERLAITLRYLASGDSMKSIGYYGFRIGAATFSNIIKETCALIWKKLQFVFPTPSVNMWKDVAKRFEEKWGFPNCIGAIDGKHVIVQAFPNHNSLTFNYKHSHSLILMAVVNADYKFIAVDIGALGHNNDSSIFRSSRFGQPNSNQEAPFVFVADEAFPLRTNIMRPYPGPNVGNLPPERTVFNNMLSRARRVVENAFGILANRFRIYRRPIIASKETTKNIVKATVCLHNWLRDKSTSGYFPQEDKISEMVDDVTHHGLTSLRAQRNNHAAQDAIAVRDLFTQYFNEQHYSTQ